MAVMKIFQEDDLSKSYFRAVVEEKGIHEKTMKIEWEDNVYYMGVSDMVGLVETYPESEQKEIKDTITKINFYNGDLLHYFTFLALCYIKSLQIRSDDAHE